MIDRVDLAGVMAGHGSHCFEHRLVPLDLDGEIDHLQFARFAAGWTKVFGWICAVVLQM